MACGQDPMYRPLGLACGHKACLQCALETAGMHHWKGEVQWVLASAPRAAECFECRQQNVFRGAVQLQQLGIAIEQRSGPTCLPVYALLNASSVGSCLLAAAEWCKSLACVLPFDAMCPLAACHLPHLFTPTSAPKGISY